MNVRTPEAQQVLGDNRLCGSSTITVFAGRTMLEYRGG